MRGRLVGAVHGRVGTAGYRASIEDQGLVGDIQTDRGFLQDARLTIGTRNETKEFPAGVAEEAPSHCSHMDITVSESDGENESSNSS